MADDVFAPREILLLNRRFGSFGRIAFREGPGGFPVAVLAGPHASCEVCLYGGQLLSYRPIGHAPVIWRSACSAYERGKAIRGGIPVCWPWFGPHPERADLPLHGFARLLDWNIAATETTAEKSELRLSLRDTPETLALWPHPFSLELEVLLGQNLRLRLTSRNTGDAPFTYTEALHGYYVVRRIEDVRVRGLEGAPFEDRLAAGSAPQTEDAPVAIAAETDRVYRHEGEAVISDSGIGREIVLAKSGSRSTVVWNPWKDKSRRMPDFGDDEYHKMICVEQANAGGAAVTLAPGESHAISLTLRVDLKA